LDHALAPASETALVRSVATLRAAFPATNDGEENAKLAISLYVRALAPYPEWAVNEVCRQFLEGRRGTGTFAPTAPEMARACREEVNKFVDERAKIEAVLDAEILPPIDPDMQKRAADVLRWQTELRPQMAAKDDAKKPKETPEQTLERLQATASQPITIGAGLAKILTDMKKGEAA